MSADQKRHARLASPGQAAAIQHQWARVFGQEHGLALGSEDLFSRVGCRFPRHLLHSEASLYLDLLKLHKDYKAPPVDAWDRVVRGYGA